MTPKFVINGKEYEFPATLNLGEEAEVERITGQGYDLTKPGALGMLALAFIAVRRIDPTVRLEDLEVLGADDFAVKGDEPKLTPLPNSA